MQRKNSIPQDNPAYQNTSDEKGHPNITQPNTQAQVNGNNDLKNQPYYHCLPLPEETLHYEYWVLSNQNIQLKYHISGKNAEIEALKKENALLTEKLQASNTRNQYLEEAIKKTTGETPETAILKEKTKIISPPKEAYIASQNICQSLFFFSPEDSNARCNPDPNQLLDLKNIKL